MLQYSLDPYPLQLKKFKMLFAIPCFACRSTQIPIPPLFFIKYEIMSRGFISSSLYAFFMLSDVKFDRRV